MSVISPTTPFPLGVYIGNPDNSSPANEALFEAQYNSFSQLMGTAPQFLDFFLDQNQPVSQWIGNAMWEANSASQSPDAKGLTPVIALPMASTANPSMTADQYYKAFTSGQFDSVITGVVQAWAHDGFSTQYWRPGWEMNLTSSVSYAGSDAATQADWVAAFQHISSVLHQAGQANGVTVQVVWNPGTINYSDAEATTNLYPGNASVDVIGADIYSDMYPYNPLYDWHKNDGTIDSSLAQWMADPVNRQHYWTYPAATPYSLDGSQGHSLSLTDLLQFAKLQGKPLAIPETGAGNSDSGHDVADDAAFPQWLAQTLHASGNQIGFVSLWDSNGGGNLAFSSASDGKPAEAAAWATSFGATIGSSTPAPTTLGKGSDTVSLKISEDSWQGDAQFTISVDGSQIGGTQTAVASHAAGQDQTYNVLGNFGAGTHSVSVNFLNDAYAGTQATDRNLYVDGATINGAAVPGSNLALLSNGPQSFWYTSGAATAQATTDVLDVHVSEDAWLGDAQFTVAIDGTTIGGVRTATASHAAGASQDFKIAGNWGPGPHSIGMTFINDAWGGTPSTDRNLYIDQVTYDGQAASGGSGVLLSNGTATYVVPGTISTTALTLHMSEDAWQGDAMYAVSVDGNNLGPVGTITASNAQGLSQAVTLQAALAQGMHELAISFLNDAYGGTPATDRNLYVKGIDVNGTPASGATATLLSTGTAHFQIIVPAS